MHILLITAHFEPEQGAAPVILTRLARALRGRGHDLTVLTALPSYPQGRVYDGYRDAWEVTETADGLRVIRTWLWATPSPKISRKLVSQVSFALTAALRGLGLPRPDAALVEAQPMFTHLAGAALCRLRGIPYVLDVHDLWPDHLLTVGALTAQHPVYRVFRALTNASLRGAAGIITLSAGWAKTIQEYIGPTDNVQTVLSGIDLNRFHPGADAAAFRAKHGLGAARLVSFIGAFTTQYDFETMFAAVHTLDNLKEVRFMFAGGGTQTAHINALLAQSAGAHIARIGWVDYDDVPLAYAASDVCFWAMRPEPLYRGTMPTKLYEALAAGLPTAAAVDGVAADFLRETGAGFNVPCGDAAGLAAAVARLLDDDALRARCGRAGRAYAEAHLDYERAADAYAAALEKAAGG